MNEEQLIKLVVDQIKEAQLKLGAEKETIRLYFPMASLNGILETDFQKEDLLLQALRTDPVFDCTVLGRLKFFSKNERFEVRVPPEGAVYVAENVPDPPFLSELIRSFERRHHMTIEEICSIFAGHGAYICEKMTPDTDFDYSIRFEDMTQDPYYYCIKMEMGHTIYHRFTETDYQALLTA